MKVKKKVFVLWYALCINWMVVQAGNIAKNHRRIRLKPSARHRVYNPIHNVSSKSNKGRLFRDIHRVKNLVILPGNHTSSTI